jgi:hypothetical protein
MTQNELDLIHAHLSGTIGKEDFAELQSLLRSNAESRSALRDLATVDTKLEKLASGNEATQSLLNGPSSLAAVKAGKPTRWFAWRPLTAAAAGLVMGLFSASVVFGYVVPLARSLSLLEENFEDAAVIAAKVTLEPGLWRGDHAVVVGAEQDVKPMIGEKMLRFLRSDSPSKARPAGGHIADVYRLIDLRGLRQDFSDGEAVVQASASVNATPFSEQQKFGCAISLFALDAESLPESASYVGTALESEANAMARCSRTKLDRDPASWQRLSTEMRLPANTEFLVVRLHISQNFESDGSSVFTGSYADDVRVTLTQRTLLP